MSTRSLIKKSGVALQTTATTPTPVAPVHRSAVLAGMPDLAEWTRKECAERLGKLIKDETRDEYRRSGVRLEKTRSGVGEPVDLSAFETKPKTYYAFRAAVRYHAAEQGAAACKDYDRARKAKDEVAKAEAYQRLVQYAADLKKFGADASPLNSKAVALGLEDATHGAPSQAKADGRIPEANRAASKLKAANSINRKVPAWREVLWARLVHVKSKWLDHAAVAALSGARPAELETAQIQRVGNDLRITLNGAKVSSTKGQPWRSMLIKNDGGSEFAHLFAKANNGQTVIGLPKDVTDYPDAFSAALARAGKSCFPAKTERMSGYVYRHSFASDLKADGFAKNDIAAALGHVVTKTQDTYGRAVGGKAGARSLSVTCARQIKQTHDTRYTSGPSVDINSVSGAPQTVTFNTPSFGDLGL